MATREHAFTRANTVAHPQAPPLALVAPHRGRAWRGHRLRRILLTADLLALLTAFAVSELYDSVSSGDPGLTQADGLLILLGAPIWVVLAQLHGLYRDTGRADHGLAEEAGPTIQMATLWTWSILLGTKLLGLGSPTILEAGIFWAVAIASVLGLRSVLRAWSRRQAWYIENAVVVASPDRAGSIVEKLHRHPEYGINVLASVDPEPSPPGQAAADGVIRGEEALFALVEELPVDRAILASWPGSSDERFDLVDRLTAAGLHVDLVPTWFEVLGQKLELHQMEGTPLLRVPSPALARSSLMLKRAFDLTIAFFALLIFAPLFAACALAIKLDTRGSVFFRQRRVGKDGQVFHLVKFRSMETDADERKAALAELNAHGGGIHTGMFKVHRDPRVTRVGRVLRQLSLDELPQLLNVLRGDMSLVGARPLIEAEDRQVEGRLRRRLALPPGMTGLWQTHGRSSIPFETMLHLDYLYVSAWSLWGDAKILLRTASAVLSGRGAY